MKIEYSLSLDEKKRLESRLATTELIALDRMHLLYHYTEGKVKLICTGEPLELSMPVLDFAWSLLHILNSLYNTGRAIFEFTDSADTILFQYSDNVTITADSSQWRCQCSYDDLKISVVNFAQTLLNDLCGSVPGLENNSLIQESRTKLIELA